MKLNIPTEGAKLKTLFNLMQRQSSLMVIIHSMLCFSYRSSARRQKNTKQCKNDLKICHICSKQNKHKMVNINKISQQIKIKICEEIREITTISQEIYGIFLSKRFSSTRSCHQELCHFLIGLLRNNKTSNSFI